MDQVTSRVHERGHVQSNQLDNVTYSQSNGPPINSPCGHFEQLVEVAHVLGFVGATQQEVHVGLVQVDDDVALPREGASVHELALPPREDPGWVGEPLQSLPSTVVSRTYVWLVSGVDEDLGSDTCTRTATVLCSPASTHALRRDRADAYARPWPSV